MNLMKKMVQFVIVLISRMMFSQRTLFFESFPEISGSPLAIYNELKKRGFEKKYKLVWLVDKNFQAPPNFLCVNLLGGRSVFQWIRRNFILARAKLIVDSNRFVHKVYPQTYRLYAQHGAALKKTFDYTHNLGDVDAVLSLSENMSEIENKIYIASSNKFVALGYPANDALFESRDFDKSVFGKGREDFDSKYKRVIGWLPTYRQNRKGGNLNSSVVFAFGVPLLKTEADFICLNETLKENDTLLAIQMHHAQAKNFPRQDCSNIVLISPELKRQYDVSTADLMRCFDAMITDYSAAYYEYLLLNRPIALSVDDYEEYSRNPGFSIDYFDWIKGVYLKDSSDLMNFVKEVARGKDSAKIEREKSLYRIHKYVDNHSTQRVVDYLVEKAGL